MNGVYLIMRKDSTYKDIGTCEEIAHAYISSLMFTPIRLLINAVCIPFINIFIQNVTLNLFQIQNLALKLVKPKTHTRNSLHKVHIAQDKTC